MSLSAVPVLLLVQAVLQGDITEADTPTLVRPDLIPDREEE